MDACRACDDFTEMHLFKLVACCQRECEVMDSRYHWLYMCATAKSVTVETFAERAFHPIAIDKQLYPNEGPRLAISAAALRVEPDERPELLRHVLNHVESDDGGATDQRTQRRNLHAAASRVRESR